MEYFEKSTVTTEGLVHAHTPRTSSKRMRINLEIGTFAPILCACA